MAYGMTIQYVDSMVGTKESPVYSMIFPNGGHIFFQQISKEEILMFVESSPEIYVSPKFVMLQYGEDKK